MADMAVEFVRARTKFSHEFALPRVISRQLRYLALIDAYTKTGSARKSPERIFALASAYSNPGSARVVPIGVETRQRGL